ncbi:MAG: dihydrofolate reductase family protein [Alistipes sp.]|nr:dihydrofolate reductase family protein [Alistipes sp.]
MRVIVSVALSADGCLDDCTSRRLMLSTPEDWAEVHRLRAGCDAILVGAETVRRDNPSLLTSDEALCRLRLGQGLGANPLKVTLSRSCRLPADSRFFGGDAEKIVFTQGEASEALRSVATVIRSDEEISAALIVTELEKRGVKRLLVEGGAQVLRMFFAENMVDEFRLAVNPAVRVDDPRAPRPEIGEEYLRCPCTRSDAGGMQVAAYTLREERGEEDLHWLRVAVDESRRCVPCATSYCVGAVVVTEDGRAFRGYTHETSATGHAEQEAVRKALAAGAELRGATIYSSMEPCSTRKSEPESCSELILRHGFRRAVFVVYEPDCFVCCRGALNLRRGGVEVRADDRLAVEVRAINGHLGH